MPRASWPRCWGRWPGRRNTHIDEGSTTAKESSAETLKLHALPSAIAVVLLAGLIVFAVQFSVRRDPVFAHAQLELFGMFLEVSIVFLAASKFVATRERAYLPLAATFLAGALLDIVHEGSASSLSGLGPLPGMEIRTTLAGFSWWLGRMVLAAGYLWAAVWIYRPGEMARPAQRLWSAAFVAIALIAFAVFLASQPGAPAYYGVAFWPGRFLELLPVPVFSAALFVLWRARDAASESQRGVGLVAVGLSLLVQGFAFSSAAPYDSRFLAAHMVKVGSFAVVLFGLYADHANLFSIERRLRESLERAHGEVIQGKRELDAIINNMAEGVCVADRAGRLVRVNRAGEEILGRQVRGEAPDAYTTAFGVETSAGKPFPAKDYPIAIALRERRAAAGVEMVIQRPNGVRRTIIAGAVPLLDAHGEINGAVATFHDVTEIRHAEQAYRDLTEQAPDAVVVMDDKGRIRFFNAAAERMFEYGRDEITGRDVTALMPERYREPHLEARRRLLRSPQPEALKRTIEVHGLKKSGREFPLEVSLSAIPTPTGVNFIGNLHDTTAQHRIRREREAILSVVRTSTSTQSLDEFLQQSIQSVVDATEFDACTLFLMDGQRRHLILRASAKIPEEIRQRISRYPLRPDFPALAVQTVLQNRTLVEPHLQSRKDLIVTPELSRKYGFQVVLSSPIRVTNEILGVVQVIADQYRHPQEEDIKVLELLAHELGLAIRQKQLVQRLEEYTEDLARANQELDSFIYTASHDLAEPLRSISNFSHFLLEDYAPKLDEEGRDHLRRINAGAGRMKRLLDDLLRLSRFGRHQALRERVDLHEIVAEVQESLDASLRERKAEIVVNGPLPEIEADRTSLVEVLSNLVSNGIKFNEHDRPRIEVGATRRDGGVEVYVRDNGIGIPPEHQDRVFGLFTRLHTRREYPGTGAGLAIVKKIVETQGGRIWVESQPGRGSTFYFTLPAEASDEKP